MTVIFLNALWQHCKELLSCCWSAFYLYRLIHKVPLLVRVPILFLFFSSKQINYFSFTVRS